MGLGNIVAKGLIVATVGGVVMLGVAAAGVVFVLKCQSAWADLLTGRQG
jgi:hypothetical protein